MGERIVAVVPIKLNNERLPGKNTKCLKGRPLISYILETLAETKKCQHIFVYCSQESIVPYLTDGAELLKRNAILDEPTSNFTQIFESLIEQIDADIYVYAHATAPFLSKETVGECICAVESGEYDSAFTAVRIQDFLWKDGEPLNFDAQNLPRSQDLEPIYRETSGLWVLRKEVFLEYKRRIGINPYIAEISFKEAIDINTQEDFDVAEIMADVSSFDGSSTYER